MDRELLTAEIRKWTGVTVGLRFRTISVAARTQLSKDQLVKAIHVEIDETNYFGDKARVEDLYRADKEDQFPLDIKLRLCPQIQDATDPTSTVKLERLRIRQAAFLANVQKTISGDIGVLDYEDGKLENWTLRNLLMNIRDEDGVRVFVSVDRYFTGRGFVFQYTSKFANTAPAWIRGLIPYFRSQLEPDQYDQILKCFTMEAATKAMFYEWDPVKKCVVSAADRLVNELLECDLDEEFEFPDTDTKKFELDLSVVEKDQEKKAATALFGGGPKGVNPYDSDSVSTMASRHRAGQAAGKKNDRASAKTTEKEKQTKANVTAVDKAAVAAAITGKIRELQVELARAQGVPISSLQLGQAVENEASGVGDGNASGGSSA